MTLDPFFRYPIRTAKGGGTKCTTCEVVEECNGATKCVYPLICVSVSIAGCEGATLIHADPFIGAVRYDCDQHKFDLALDCNGYEVDLAITYELVSGTPSAVLRSEMLGIEEAIPFTETENARCPTFYFGEVTTHPYATVSLGQQQCINSGPEDCTAGRCVPRYLCMDIWSPSNPTEPYHTELEWYMNDTVTLDAACCCNANVLPELLIARVRNYSEGCTCIGPQRSGTLYYTAEQSGYSLSDAGATLHLRHATAYASDSFVSGFPSIPEGADIWMSEGAGGGDLVQVCPAPEQPATEDTRTIYARMVLWCDPADGRFKAVFETIDFSGATEYGDTSYQTPFNQDSPFSNIHVLDADILACNPFTVMCRGIVEDTNCQSFSNVNGTGLLEIVVNEFQGWTGPNPFDPELRITFYTERVNTASAVQSLAIDCYPKMHFQAQGSDTFKHRTDHFSITDIWPGHVWEGCTFYLNEMVGYQSIERVEVYPKSCTGCEGVPVEDPYIIESPCCPNKNMPSVLYFSAVQEQYCPCADDVLIELIYDKDEDAWIGEGPFGTSGCPCNLTVRLACSGLIGGQVWTLRVTPTLGAETFFQYNPLNDRVFQCDPFLWITRSQSNDSCCNPSWPASQFYWVVSE